MIDEIIKQIEDSIDVKNKKVSDKELLTVIKEAASDFSIVIPSSDTPRIQESHIMVGHIICDIVERSLFGDLK